MKAALKQTNKRRSCEIGLVCLLTQHISRLVCGLRVTMSLVSDESRAQATQGNSTHTTLPNYQSPKSFSKTVFYCSLILSTGMVT